jgi:hypothetical protein
VGQGRPPVHPASRPSRRGSAGGLRRPHVDDRHRHPVVSRRSQQGGGILGRVTRGAWKPDRADGGEGHRHGLLPHRDGGSHGVEGRGEHRDGVVGPIRQIAEHLGSRRHGPEPQGQGQPRQEPDDTDGPAPAPLSCPCAPSVSFAPSGPRHRGGAPSAAAGRSAPREVIGLVSRGCELLAHLPEAPDSRQQELDLQLMRGQATTAVKGYAAPEVEQILTRARALCEQVGDTAQLVPTLRGLCWFAVNRGALLTAR